MAPTESGLATRRGDSGVALVLALLALFVFSTLAAGLLFVTQTEIWTSYNYRLLEQARYVAEAGQQSAIDWLVNSYVPPTNLVIFDTSKSPVEYSNHPVVLTTMAGETSNYPDSAVQSAFASAFSHPTLSAQGVEGSYTVSATLLRIKAITQAFSGGSNQAALATWQITSRATVNGIPNSIVQLVATIDRQATSIFNFAIFTTGDTCANLSLSGGAKTDSFDSRQGPYSASQQASGGNVGTNGNVTISGSSSSIYGSISVINPTLGSCPAGVTVSGHPTYGTISPLGQAVVYPAPPAPDPASPTSNQGISGSCGGIPGCSDLGKKSVALAPGAYGNLNVSGGTHVHLSAGTYTINSISLSGNSPLVLDSTPVILNMAGASTNRVVDLSGGSVTNPSGVPSDFQIVYGGTGNLTLSGGSDSYGVVYAPSAPITMSGNSDWYGAIIGKSFTDSGGSAVHFDRSLLSQYQQLGPYRLLSFTQSKF